MLQIYFDFVSQGNFCLEAILSFCNSSFELIKFAPLDVYFRLHIFQQRGTA